MGQLLYAVGIIAYLVGTIIVLIAAFKKSVGTGLLCLLVPFYIVFFAFARYESVNKGKVLTLWLGGIPLAMIGIFIATQAAISPCLQNQIFQNGKIDTVQQSDQEDAAGQVQGIDEGLQPEPEQVLGRSQMRVETERVFEDFKDVLKTKVEEGKTKIEQVKRLKGDILYLKNTDIIRGKIIKETDQSVSIRISMASGTAVLNFGKDKIDKIERAFEPAQAGTQQAQVQPLAVVSSQPDTQPAPAARLDTGVVEWKSDLTDVTIPDITAQGLIHGSQFICEQAKLEKGTLELTQGKDFLPDLQLIIFLFLKEDETAENKTYNITQETGFGSPHVHMKWKPQDADLPKSETFMQAYLMRLEFGAQANGKLPGEIYICLPDEHSSVVAGRFEAEVK